MTIRLQVTNTEDDRMALILYVDLPGDPENPTRTETLGPKESKDIYIHSSQFVQIFEKEAAHEPNKRTDSGIREIRNHGDRT